MENNVSFYEATILLKEMNTSGKAVTVVFTSCHKCRQQVHPNSSFYKASEWAEDNQSQKGEHMVFIL